MAAYLITDVTVFTGEEIIKSASVLVKDGDITYVGTEPPPSNSAQVISKPGHTLLPGLIDAHVHAVGGDVSTLSQALQFGVTTVLEMGNSYKVIEGLREAAKDPNNADYRTATVPATVPGGYPEPLLKMHDTSEETAQDLATWPKLHSPADAETFMQRSLEAKADYIKILQESGYSMGAEFPSPTPEIQKAVVDAAHARGLKVIGHALCLEDTLTILRAGIDGTAHTFFDQPPTDELIEAYKANNAWCCPTLVLAASITGNAAAETKEFAHHPLVGKRLPERSKHILCQCMNRTGPNCSLENGVKSVTALKAAGINIVCGTDAATVTLGTAPGASLHQELWMYVEKCNFSTIEALKSATSITAKCFGLEDRGVIAQGKRADLLLVEGDITQDIKHSLNCKLVWKAGVMKDIS